MGFNVTQKILAKHGLDPKRTSPGTSGGLQIDRVLLRDTEGAEMACLYVESRGEPAARGLEVLCSVDRTSLALEPDQADLHRFLQTSSARHRFHFSKPGNGNAVQVFLDLFARPGQVFLGTTADVAAAGGISGLALAADPLSTALAITSGRRPFLMPKIVQVRLQGVLPPWISGRDLGLEMLRRLTVKGGAGRIFEYVGEGIRSVSVPDRATLAWFGAQFGAIGSTFPSDERTREYLTAVGRKGDWSALAPASDAVYDEYLEIDLGLLEPLVAKPHSLDNVCSVREVEGTRINQVVIGSDAGTSLKDLAAAAEILKGGRLADGVNLFVIPGSRRVLKAAAAGGHLETLLAAGAHVVESAAGYSVPDIHLPASHAVSVHTFGTNARGATGVPDAMIYFAGPEVAAVSALKGALADPRGLGKHQPLTLLRLGEGDDVGIARPPSDSSRIEIHRGSFVRPLPAFDPLPAELTASVLVKAADEVSTDRILARDERFPAQALNIPAAASQALESLDPMFARRALEAKSGILVAGERYGQGRAHSGAALVLRHLGVRAILARSFGAEHLSDLVNFGIAPLLFAERTGYDRLVQGDAVRIGDFRRALVSGKPFTLTVPARKLKILVKAGVAGAEAAILVRGGVLVKGEKARAATARSRSSSRPAARSAQSAKKKPKKVKRQSR